LFDLQGCARRGVALALRVRKLLDRVEDLSVGAMLARTFLATGAVTRKLVHDPRLPAALLPKSWPHHGLWDLRARLIDIALPRWLALTASEDSWGIDSSELRALLEAVATSLRIPGTRARTEIGGDDAARID
jgi:DNA-binding transcriptional regulator PaaX